MCAALFQQLFNILYEESINCRLSKSTLQEDKMLNWNRINAQICFNYLQQEFYLVTPTMKTLAAGKSQKAILKLLRILINTSQAAYGNMEQLDNECIRDIADIIEADNEPAGQAAAADNDAGSVPSDVRPRGAVLTTSDADQFYEEPIPSTKKGAQAAAAVEESKQ